VACVAPRAVPVATVARSAYEAAGVDTGEAPEGPTRPTGQLHTGGRVGGAGRPSDTRRDTWRTLGPGMQRAVCGSLVNRGLEPVLRALFGRSPPVEVHERIHDGLSQRAREYYRGEVWPLRDIFGVLSRFPAGLVDGAGAVLTPTVVTTWLSDNGTIVCSCVGRVALVARHGEVPADGTCQHAARFRGALSYLAARLGVSLSTIRRIVPRLFGEESGDPRGIPTASGSGDSLDWDADGTIEAFRTGQTAVAVVLSGTGSAKVPAPVRCTRKGSHCEFCDSAAGFSCVHAVRARSVRRGDSTEEPTPASDSNDDNSDGTTAIDDSQSTLPLPIYNCPRSVRVDAKVCRYMREGKTLAVPAPSSCPTCGSARTKDNSKVDVGEVLCSEGYAIMEMGSFYCNNKDCQRWIFPDGRAEGLVIQSCTTASTAVLMRDMASEMVTSGSPFKSCFKHWTNQFMDRRDSGAYPNMKVVKMRSRQTVTSMFFLTLELMVKEPPLWAFRCSTCQNKDGRFRTVTADGIWLGYLKRLASTKYTIPSEVCTSVRDTVRAASIHPSEWVRRFLRMTLKQPSKPIVIKVDQLNSAKRALAFLCPASLPQTTESTLSVERREQLSRLRTFLGSLWDLDRATVSLVSGIIVQTRKLLAARHSLPDAVVTDHQRTLQQLHAWQIHVEQGPDGGGVAGGVGVAVGDGAPGAGIGADAAAGVAVGAGLNGRGADAAAPDVARGQAAGVRAVRRPGATARRHHKDRTVNEPLDPRCLRPAIKALGPTTYRDILSFAVAVTIDPVVNPFKQRHCAALTTIAGALKATNGWDIVTELKRRVSSASDAAPPVHAADMAPPAHAGDTVPPGVGADAAPEVHIADVPLPMQMADGTEGPQERDTEPLAVGVDAQPPVAAAADTQPLEAAAADVNDSEADNVGDLTEAVELLTESRLLYSFLVAMSGSVSSFSALAKPAADVLLSVRAAVEDFHVVRVGKDGTSAAYQARWGDEKLTPAELRSRFVTAYPNASDDPAVTGAWFPGLLACRPAAFAPAEEAELGTCAKNYEDAHKFFSPGTFTICCACAHPKMLGFVVLDKREGPPALLNALLTHFALLPYFVVYDFACGALRSAIGKLPFFVAMVVLVSDLFHIVNHLCSDALHPRSYQPLDKANTVAHEQRNAPINLLRRTLRSVGQREYMGVLKMENVVYNVMAQAKSTCPYALPESYNYRQYYFSRTPCSCGCEYHPDVPPQPSLPPPIPDEPSSEEDGPEPWAGVDFEPLDS